LGIGRLESASPESLEGMYDRRLIQTSQFIAFTVSQDLPKLLEVETDRLRELEPLMA